MERRRMPIMPLRREDESFRAHQARIAIGLVRPCLLVIGLVAAALNEFSNPGSVPADGWARLAIFGALQVLFWGLLRTSLAMEHVALTAFALDGAVLAATLRLNESPAASATTFVVLIVIVGYFARPGAAMAFSVVTAGVVAVIGPKLEGWNDPAPLPTVSVAILITGAAMAYLSSRMRADEQRLRDMMDEQRASVERLRQVDAARDRLIANVSHELRTPLTSTIGSIETLLRPDVELDSDQRAILLRLARDGGLRLLSLVEDLLTLGSTRPDSLELSTSPERVSTLLRDSVAGLDPGPDRAIVVHVDDDAFVHVDRLRMLQVFTNLAVNAIRHGDGDVVVKAHRDPDAQAVVVEVVDAGPGVPAEHVNELFLPFARFSSRRDSTGLGLAICRTIVEAHGGTIHYERTDEDQTAFIVELPIDEPTSP